jgi:hypothetical protein
MEETDNRFSASVAWLAGSRLAAACFPNCGVVAKEYFVRRLHEYLREHYRTFKCAPFVNFRKTQTPKT